MADNPMSAPVYLATRYSRRLELCGYAAELESHGYTCLVDQVETWEQAVPWLDALNLSTLPRERAV